MDRLQESCPEADQAIEDPLDYNLPKPIESSPKFDGECTIPFLYLCVSSEKLPMLSWLFAPKADTRNHIPRYLKYVPHTTWVCIFIIRETLWPWLGVEVRGLSIFIYFSTYNISQHILTSHNSGSHSGSLQTVGGGLDLPGASISVVRSHCAAFRHSSDPSVCKARPGPFGWRDRTSGRNIGCWEMDGTPDCQVWVDARAPCCIQKLAVFLGGRHGAEEVGPLRMGKSPSLTWLGVWTRSQLLHMFMTCFDHHRRDFWANGSKTSIHSTSTLVHQNGCLINWRVWTKLGSFRLTCPWSFRDLFDFDSFGGLVLPNPEERGWPEEADVLGSQVNWSLPSLAQTDLRVELPTKAFDRFYSTQPGHVLFLNGKARDFHGLVTLFRSNVDSRPLMNNHEYWGGVII